MNTTMRWFTLALVIGMLSQSGVAGTVLGTAGQTCYPSPTSRTSQGITASTYSVTG